MARCRLTGEESRIERAKMTAEYLRSILDYDPATGVFRWKDRADIPKNINSGLRGTVAGSLEKSGYAVILINKVRYRAHRLAWLYTHGEWPNSGLDHRTCERARNPLDNLRPASQSQNIANGRLRKNNSTGFKGVSRRKHRFVAQIKKDREGIHLGVFDTPEEAHAAYVARAHELFGEFARAG